MNGVVDSPDPGQGRRRGISLTGLNHFLKRELPGLHDFLKRNLVPRARSGAGLVTARIPWVRRSGLIIERMEVDLVLSRIAPAKPLRVLDIGSHHGELLDILELHPDRHRCQVICVEPERSNIAVLKARVRCFRRLDVTLCPVAISDRSGAKPFFTASASTLFTCSEDWKVAFPDFFKDSREVAVPCLTISDLALRYSISSEPSFDFVKIDTEGHDLAVLSSLLASPITADALMFEIGFHHDLDTVEGCELLRAAGYAELYVFARTGLPTTYIGEWQGVTQLADLRSTGRLLAGNIVAFRS